MVKLTVFLSIDFFWGTWGELLSHVGSDEHLAAAVKIGVKKLCLGFESNFEKSEKKIAKYSLRR